MFAIDYKMFSLLLSFKDLCCRKPRQVLDFEDLFKQNQNLAFCPLHLIKHLLGIEQNVT